MIITEENKDKKLPIPPAPGTSTASASEAGDAEPPPYDHSDLGTSTGMSSSMSTGTTIRGPETDLLAGNPDDYSAGPSVLPPGQQQYADPIPPNLPKQNKLRVHKDNHSIKDMFVIDANLPAPPGAGTQKNLDLYSANGSVTAKVYLVGVDVKRRVELAAKSKNGSVKFQIAECPRTMFIDVNCESHNGSVTVLLPPKFTGPLSITHKNGSVTLFPSLKARTRTLDESSTVRRCWVGEWPGEGEWDGDQCIVGSENGSVRIGFWEGEQPEQPGFFRRLFG